MGSSPKQSMRWRAPEHGRPRESQLSLGLGLPGVSQSFHERAQAPSNTVTHSEAPFPRESPIL